MRETVGGRSAYAMTSDPDGFKQAHAKALLDGVDGGGGLFSIFPAPKRIAESDAVLKKNWHQARLS